MNQPDDPLCINTLRFLALDMVNSAKSGHPGTPMGVAPLAYVLWGRVLRHAPHRPDWPDRDRFLLSNGHASALLYGLLHLSGYDLSLEDLKQFRQLNSRTPGHPERLHTPGIEMTTGALGQGFAAGVGFALAEARLAAEFNQPDSPPVVDHYTYVLCSDGDMMEGITAEAASLAGHLKLGKLIAIYDDNQVTIEGQTGLAFEEDVAGRFLAYGWQTLRVADGNDLQAVTDALRAAQAERSRPSLILARTVIGYGNPRQGTAAAHFGALNPEEMAFTRQALGWTWEEPYHVPCEVQVSMSLARERGERLCQDWEDRLARYAAVHPELAAELRRRLAGELPQGWEAALPVFNPNPQGEATRMANGPIVNALAGVLPELLGGAADLAPNTQTLIKDSPDLAPASPAGRNLHFGVREHVMAAVTNGLALHGGFRPYAATFLIFSDYLRPALRIGALSQAPAIFLFTNDSIGVGEDGPTHQPIEQLAALRAMPGITLLRPSDANEVVEAWKFGLTNRLGPTCIVQTRQPVPILDRAKYAPAEYLQRGGYILSEAPGGRPQALLIATGSEVSLALQAQEQLIEQNVAVRVVALPGWSLFQAQPQEYRDAVLPPAIKARVSIEAGSSFGWERWVGESGVILSIDHFGLSAPWQEAYRACGLTARAVVDAVLSLVA
jgi:transketolase